MKGFILAQWLGYLSAVLYIHRPWGHPRFDSWKTPLIPWGLVLLVVQLGITYDVSLNEVLFTPEEVESSTNQPPKSRNPFFGYLHMLILGSTILVVTSFRLTLLFKAKRIAKLLNTLSRYKFLRPKETQEKWRGCWIATNIGLAISLCFVIFGAVLFAIVVGRYSDTSIISFMGGAVVIPYFIMYVTILSSRYVAFALIMSVSLYIGMIYIELGDVVEDQLILLGATGFNECSNPNACKLFGGTTISKESLEAETSRIVDLADRVERLNWIGSGSERLLGPFVLITLTSSVWMLITGSYNTLIGTGLFGLSILQVAEQLVYIISLIFMGQAIQDVLKMRRKRFKRLLTLNPRLSLSPMGDLAQLLMAFQWRLTGCSIFDVNKQLFSGIVKTSLTYVVALFQFQLALEPPKNKRT